MKHIVRKYSKVAIIIALIFVLITIVVNRYQYKEDKAAVLNHQIADEQLLTDDVVDEMAEGT
jgi:hypothetical protein